MVEVQIDMNISITVISAQLGKRSGPVIQPFTSIRTGRSLDAQSAIVAGQHGDNTLVIMSACH